MNFKKVISAIWAVTLLFCSISFVRPLVYAEEKREYILNDTFDKKADGSFDTSGWEIGESNSGMSAVFPSSHWAMPDMVLVSIPKGGNTSKGNQAILRKKLEKPIDITKHRVILETVISTDTTSGLNIDFGYNRPEKIDEIPENAIANNLYTMFRLTASGMKNSKGQNIASVSMLNPAHGLTQATNYAAATGTPSETDGKVKLAFQDSVKIKVVLDYDNQLISYYIAAPDGGVYTRDGWNDKGNMKVDGVCPDILESIDISAWCANGSKFWIDYIKLYTLDPLMNDFEADREIDGGYQVDKNGKTVIEADFETGDNLTGTGFTIFYHSAGETEKKNVNIPVEGLQNNIKYSLKITIDNKEKNALYEIYENGEKTIENAEITGVDFAKLDIIDKISAEGMAFKDEAKIYNQKASVKAKLVKKENAYIYHLGDKITLSFDSPVDESEIKDSIKFICDDEIFEVEGKYNKDTGDYVFSLDGLKTGDWQIELSDELIYNNNGEMSFSDNLIDFHYIGSSKPRVENVRLSGKVKEGDIITPRFDYFQNENIPIGESIHEWYISDTFDGVYTKIDDETEEKLTVKSDMVGKYIKYSVIPVTSDGAVGERVFSENVIAPEVVPFVTNAKVSGTAAVGATLSLEYTFNDANEDEEGSSEYQWYISDNSENGFLPIDGETKKSYRVKDSDYGKYIKASVVPVSSAVPERGEMVYTLATGKIGDIIEMTNLVSNPDFEKGNITGWSTFNFASGDGVFIASAANSQPAVGEYSLYVKGKTSASHTYISPSFTLQGGKTYIAGGKVYPTDGTMSKIYAKTNTLTGVTLTTPYKINESGDAAANKWTSHYTTWVVDGASCSDSRLSLQSDSYTEDFYVDDVYVGELEIADIDADFSKNEITVPQNGKEEIVIDNIKILNQVGTTHGLTEETVSWKLAEDYRGVSIDGNIITVDESAIEGEIEILAVCRPKFTGHAVEVFEKGFTVRILPHSDVAPNVTNVKITGAVEEGETLKGTYEYYQVNGFKDASTYRWLVSDSKNGEYSVIAGADGIEYTVTKENADKFIKLEVTPLCEEGIYGNATESNIACGRIAPKAENVIIEGEHFIGSKLVGKYEFSDANMDDEGVSKFRWLVCDTLDGTYTEIENATESEYILTEKEVNKYLKIAVIPVSKEAPYEGIIYYSKPFKGPKTPEARNVKINKNSTKLTGSYDYYHEFSVSEGKSRYEWVRDGKVISNDISIIVDFSGKVTFNVTPVAVNEPYEGETVSVTINVSKNTGGSGGGGGGSSSSFITGSIQKPITPEVEENKTETISDLENHWAKEYAYKMISKDIMKNDEANLFNPGRTATRAEIISWVAKISGIKAVDYRDEFSDVVKTDDFSGYLQAMVDEGIISQDVKFRPDDNITREELCKVLYITLNNREKMSVNSDIDISKFTDKDNISKWAIDYVDGILDSGIMIGTSDTEFTPRGNCTKAQMAVVLTRLMNLLGE